MRDTHQKQKARKLGSVGAFKTALASSLQNTTCSYDSTTGQQKGTALKLSTTAKVLLRELKPWNSWPTQVQPAPEVFPGAVKTAKCRFCGQPHFFIGRTGPDDPGIRALPCGPNDLLDKWQVPPYPQVTVMQGVAP